MEDFKNCRLVLLKPDSSDGVIFLPSDPRNRIYIGRDTQCDIRINNEAVARKHLVIYLNSFGKIKICNISGDEKTVMVNNQEVSGKLFIKSGDIIDVLGSKMRWESKSEKSLSSRATLLPKSSKNKGCIKTKQRITIHKVNLPEKPACPEIVEPLKDGHDDQQAMELEKSKKIPCSNLEGREDLSASFNLKSLNISGTLLTSYVPERFVEDSPLAKTPTKAGASVNPSPAKSGFKILQENNVSSLNTSSTERNSMHFIDFNTPKPLKLKTTSTPKTTRKGDTLLKSLLRNDSEKNKAAVSEELKSNPAQSQLCSSVYEVSSSLENDETNTVEDETALKNSEHDDDNKDDPDSQEEIQQLLDSISSVLDEKDIAEVSDESLERNFNKTEPNQPASTENLQNETDQFDSLIGRPSISRTYSAKKQSSPEAFQESSEATDEIKVKERAEAVFKWMDGVRESLSTVPSKGEQILSTRYSNITPNDSIANSTLPNYEATKAKLSILHTVEHFNRTDNSFSKMNELTVSPVTKLSVSENCTEVVENFRLGKEADLSRDVTKSLRSTRKQIGNAITSLNDISRTADSTIELNKTDFSEKEQMLDQTEDYAILSLDDQPAENLETVKDNQEIGEAVHSNVSIKFVKSNTDADEFADVIYELDASEIDASRIECISDDEDEPTSEHSEEPVGSEMVDEIVSSAGTGNAKESQAIQFHFKENDFEEGINPLESSLLNESQDNNQNINQENEGIEKSEELEVETPSSQISEEIPAPEPQKIETALKEMEKESEGTKEKIPEISSDIQEIELPTAEPSKLSENELMDTDDAESVNQTDGLVNDENANSCSKEPLEDEQEPDCAQSIAIAEEDNALLSTENKVQDASLHSPNTGLEKKDTSEEAPEESEVTQEIDCTQSTPIPEEDNPSSSTGNLQEDKAQDVSVNPISTETIIQEENAEENEKAQEAPEEPLSSTEDFFSQEAQKTDIEVNEKENETENTKENILECSSDIEEVVLPTTEPSMVNENELKETDDDEIVGLNDGGIVIQDEVLDNDENDNSCSKEPLKDEQESDYAQSTPTPEEDKTLHGEENLEENKAQKDSLNSPNSIPEEKEKVEETSEDIEVTHEPDCSQTAPIHEDNTSLSMETLQENEVQKDSLSPQYVETTTQLADVGDNNKSEETLEESILSTEDVPTPELQTAETGLKDVENESENTEEIIPESSSDAQEIKLPTPEPVKANEEELEDANDNETVNQTEGIASDENANPCSKEVVKDECELDCTKLTAFTEEDKTFLLTENLQEDKVQEVSLHSPNLGPEKNEKLEEASEESGVKHEVDSSQPTLIPEDSTSIPKKNLQETESEKDTENPPIAETTQVKGTRRNKKVEEPSKEVKEEIPTRAAEANLRSTRKRNAAPLQDQTDVKPDLAVATPKTKSANNKRSAEDASENPDEETSKRPRRAARKITEVEEKPTEAKPPARKRNPRGKAEKDEKEISPERVEKTSETEEAPEESEMEAAKSTKSSDEAKTVQTSPEQKLPRSRRGASKVQAASQESEDQVEKEARVPVKKRKLKEISETSEPAQEETPIALPEKRSRRAASRVQELASKELDSASAQEQTPSKRSRRAASKAQEVVSKELEPAQEQTLKALPEKRSRRAASRVQEVVSQELEPAQEQTPSKRSRRAASKVQEVKSQELHTEPAQEQTLKALPEKRSRRAASRVQEVESQELDSAPVQEQTPSKRSRRAASKVQEVVSKELDPTPAKRGKRGQAKAEPILEETKKEVQEVVSKELEPAQEPTPSVLPEKRSRRAASKVQEVVSQELDSTPAKRGKRGQAKAEVIVEKTKKEVVSQELDSTPAKRGKRGQAKAEVIVEEMKQEDPEENVVASASKKKALPKKQPAAEVADTAQPASRSLRSRKLPQRYC